jgi:hypothetical protein
MAEGPAFDRACRATRLRVLGGVALEQTRADYIPAGSFAGCRTIGERIMRARQLLMAR